MGPDTEAIDYEKAQEMVDYALAHGINYIDTAHMYHDGASEEFVGHALKNMTDTVTFSLLKCRSGWPKLRQMWSGFSTCS